MPDDVIHLPGPLQFRGFRSVVGTLWAMADIYQWARCSRGLLSVHVPIADFRGPTKALIATKEMGKVGVPFGQWMNFVHIRAQELISTRLPPLIPVSV